MPSFQPKIYLELFNSQNVWFTKLYFYLRYLIPYVLSIGHTGIMYFCVNFILFLLTSQISLHLRLRTRAVSGC